MDKKESGGKYNRRAHSVCCLIYHAVFVIKYRRKVIDAEIMEFMKNHTRYLIEDRFNGKMIEFNGDEDHIHILFELPPSAAPSVIVCSLKTQLSKEVRKRYMEQIQGKLWKDSFWSDSYFLSTTGGANVETLDEYIKQQGIEKLERPKRKYVKRKRK
ncbi:IS200/IS605 family transposase [Ruminococcus sp. RTP21484sp1_RTP31023st1_H8_RTP31023_210422]|uniref:IS200/IS605 family transposase n=1 Tax=Ruminococcus sp. RTP21484sp1_RTP31023st1_H8_RTP31023_210422 TaxID=3141611 RepID=UPI0034A13312